MSSELENRFKDIIKEYYNRKKRTPTLSYILDEYDDLFTNNEVFIEKKYKPIYDAIILHYKETPKNILDAKPLTLRDYQEEYVNEALNELHTNSRCLIDAPTGSGKTKMAFVIQSSLIKAHNRMIYVFVSPLLRINKQCLKDSYLYYNTKFNTSGNLNPFEEIEVNSANKGYIEKINYVLRETGKNLLLSTTYQSIDKIFKMNINIDLLILDEAHCIPAYVHSKKYFVNLNQENDYEILSDDENGVIEQTNTNLKKKEWYNIFFSDIVQKRLFLTATPYDYQIEDDGNDGNNRKYGKHINKIRLGELIEKTTLSGIKTYIASVKDRVNVDKSNYDRPDTAASILTFIKTAGRYRLCIFVNNCKNAAKLKKCILDCPLYKSFRQDTGLEIKEPILYLSSEDTHITDFSNNETVDNFNNNEVRIIISCKKLSMGVDIPCIDSIVFADPRMKSADISQCIGRGLRYFKYGDELKVCCILLIKYINDEKNDRNKMIFEYLDYLKKNNVFKHFGNLSEERQRKDKHIPSIWPGNEDDNRNAKKKEPKTNLKEIKIYDGHLDLDIEYYEEYSKYRNNEDKIYINEDLLEYNKREYEYNTIKNLCNNHNINSINEYLKMIGNLKNNEINKITNPEIYFTDLKIPRSKPRLWICWYDLFGKDISRMPETYDDWKLKVEELNLYDYKQYQTYCEKNNDMPYYPKLRYSGIPDLHHILDDIFE
jgi:superfamily II DNA or RNA helicase